MKESKMTLRLISLVLAVTLWFYVLNSEPLIVEKRVPLVFINPTDLAINVEVPKTVRVKLKGSRVFVQDLDLSQDKLVVDLRQYPHKQETFAVTFDPSMLRLPFGVEALDIQPPQIVLSMDREIKKIVPVRLRTVGELGKDLQLVEKEYSPKEFMIKGPYEVLKKTTLLNTAPVDLSSLLGKGEMRLPLEGIDSRVTVEERRDIEFSYTIRPNKANLTLNEIPIRFLTPHLNFKADFKEASVDVLVSEDRKNALRSKQIKVIAEVPDNATGKLRIKLRAEVPEGVNLLQIHPEFIKVSLQ